MPTRIPSRSRTIIPGCYSCLAELSSRKHRECNKTIDEIVHELGTTRTSLNEYMNSHYGMNFRAWRNSLRIEEAKHLLTESNIPLPGIYSAVGYSDRSNFHRQFTSLEGMTPLQYRNKHKNKSGDRI